MRNIARAVTATLFAAAFASAAVAQDADTAPDEAPLAAPAIEAPLTGADPNAPLAPAPGGLDAAPAIPEAAPATPQATPATPQPAPAAPPAQAAAPAPQAGDPAAGEMRVNLRETHGAWEVRCAPDNVECFMYQLARDQSSNPVAEINLVKLAEESPAAAGLNVLTPLGTLLPPGLVVQVDGSQQRQYPFSWCESVGCFVRFAVDDATVEAMKTGQVAKLTLFAVQAPGTPVVLDVSLSGFTAAFDSIAPIPN